MNLDSWLQLAAICFLGAISPGPSLALVVNNTIVKGKVYGIVTGLGHGAGIGLWALLTAAGIAKVVLGEPTILLTFQSLGACLIAYLGFRTLMVGNWVVVRHGGSQRSSSETLLRGIGEGFLISLFNPKIALFFLAIFSHLVHSEANQAEIVMMGATAATIDALWYISVASILTKSGIMQIFQKRGKLVSFSSGIFLIIVAFYLLGSMVFDLL